MSPWQRSTGTTPSFRTRLRDRARDRCEYCERPLLFDAHDGHPHRATIDHLVPRSAGGTGTLANLVLSCFECNQLKASWNPFEDDDDMMALLTA